MKSITRIALACALLLSFATMRGIARAGDEKPAPEKNAATASFDSVRALEGTWE